MDAYEARVGLASGPAKDDPYFYTALEAEDDAEDKSRRHSQVFAVWPIGRDVYHPDALAFEGFIYRREASRG